MSKTGKKHLLMSLLFLLIIILFLSFSIFFKTHFYPGTVINGIPVSFKSSETADRLLNNRASSYELVIFERGNINEIIKGKDIDLRFGYGSSSIKKIQNRTLWVLSFFNQNDTHFGNAFIYDEVSLREEFNKLKCFNEEFIIEPKNATLIYTKDGYQVVEEVNGNQLNQLKLYSKIQNAVMNGQSNIDLEKLQCYENPKIRSDSKKISCTKALAEKYLTSKIIYTFYDGIEIVDENEISEWIEFDNNLVVTFNKQKMKGFLDTLATHYNTYGSIRNFITSSGSKIEVGGGDYGWIVDINGEVVDLIEAITDGRTTFREPRFSQRGAYGELNDIGNTYVEIDMTKQHLWFYKDGILITHGNVVTGKLIDGYKTPEGIYTLK
ncbi:MAG: peptidoglycan binding domain-containing protein, partial [Bacillota bacterium]